MQRATPPVTRNKLGSETSTLKAGDRAPDFALKSHDGRDVSLGALRGKRVVLAFFHFAFTGTWGHEVPALNELQTKLGGTDVQVVGISCDTVYALKDWAEHLGGIGYPLLSDFWPHGETARRYGVFDEEKGRSLRSVFIVDRDGMVRYVDRHALSEVPDPAEIEEELAKIA